jgi:3-hydroxyacyl-[acyl-carrier-protein] dehydratase
MPPQLLFSLEGIDLERVTIPMDEVRRCNPQRHEMEQLTGVIFADAQTGRLVAERQIGADEWWVRGHIPGRPLMPGVLIIEAAAQASAFLYKVIDPNEKRFIGFGGVEGVKFRDAVRPGDRLILLAEAREHRARRAVFATQGLVGDKMVFQGDIVGIPM